ncbi:MAG: hypothetical protein M1142_04710 [Patescibacteria group bacterium]|nr:hypothetical protein [Patescibacteria group bacterium]
MQIGRPEHLGNGYFLVRTDKPAFHYAPIYTVKTADKALMSINLNFSDSFSMTWETALSADTFLKEACKLIDAISRKPHQYRPMETGNPIAVANLSQNAGESVSLQVGPSYSDFGYNNVTLPPFPSLRFDQLQWPLNLANITQVYLENGEEEQSLPQNDDKTWFRINAEFCTLFYGAWGDQWYPRRFSYWSHILALKEIQDVYAATVSYPIPKTLFTKVLEKTVAPRFPIE